MRREKRYIVSLLVLCLAILLAGCGKISKEKEVEASEFITKMITAADGAVVSRVDCITELEAELIYNSQQVENYKFQFEAHNEYDKESGRTDSEIIAYKDGKPVNLRFHMSEEQGVFYIYTKYDQDVWYKYDTGFLKADMSRNFVSDMNLENAEILDFKKDYKKVNEKSTHKLSVRFKDASIRELLFESGFKALFYGREYNSIDLSDVNVRIDYFVDSENCMVMELEVQLDGMENFLREYTRFTNNSMVEEELWFALSGEMISFHSVTGLSLTDMRTTSPLIALTMMGTIVLPTAGGKRIFANAITPDETICSLSKEKRTRFPNGLGSLA